MATDRMDSRTLQILEDIQLHASADVLRNHIQRCSRQKLESWKDGHGLDLLHYAIMENSYVAAGTFFAHGFFKPPHEPSAASWSYVHMAAALGYRSILSLLLQERPYDNKKVALDWVTFKRTIIPKLNISKTGPTVLPDTCEERSFPLWPVDVAARFGHLACVKHILDFHMLREPGSSGATARRNAAGYMDMACRLDSPFALRLLLTESDANGNASADVKSALDVALKMAKPECVDALLRHGVDVKSMFGGMNLYHVLFAYSKSFQEGACSPGSLETLTSVLLRQGHDVNASRPSRTFPLYSLLRCTRLTDVAKTAPAVLASLLLLLQAGADPNFDEVLVEEAVQDEEHKTAFGRWPYSSALHCVMDAAVNYAEEVTDKENVSMYIYKCCELLLRHGADPSYVSKYRNHYDVVRRGNVLHAFADAAVALNHVDRACLLLLLRHGARADILVDGMYPLTLYCEAVTKTEPASQNRRQHSSTVDVAADVEVAIHVKRMARMLGFMSHEAQLACERILRAKVRMGYSNPCWKVALREVEKFTLEVSCLQRVCALEVWKSCRYHVGNVYKLPIPNALISVLLNQL